MPLESLFKNKICYIYSKPIKSEGNYRKRNKPYFLVKNIENKNSEITILRNLLFIGFLGIYSK